MKKSERAFSAIMAVFPTSESYKRFAEGRENLKILRAFIDYAFINGLIPSADEKMLREMITSNARTKEMCTPPNHLNFEMFLDQKEALLELNISARALTNRINALLVENDILLPGVSNSMLTRFKKEPADTHHKQNVMRSLAFWCGHDRAHLGERWNFETLVALCSKGKGSTDYKEGVRVGFALYSRGCAIDHDTLGWLKRELKSYIDQSIGRFAYDRWGKVRSHDITTLYVDFPKENRISNPTSYRQCLQSAVSLAHQIAIRWSLSRHFSQNRFLSIGLAAGNFNTLDNHLLPVLNTKLPGDPTIRLTDYARQCILINEIRVVLSTRPAEIMLFNDETLTIWWVVGFWTALYFDFVPALLEDPVLQRDTHSVMKLAGMLWLPTMNDANADEDTANAIATFFRFPHNSLLGLEIAKTLYYRRRLWEAMEILRIILSLDPTQINARTLRMVMLRNLASDAPAYAISQGLFKQVYQEAEFIVAHCGVQSEDFYCEYAIGYLAQAMTTLRHMRNRAGATAVDGIDVETLKQEVYDAIGRADAIFSQGQMMAPYGSRSNYMRNTTKVIRNVLHRDESLFNDRDRPIDCAPETAKAPARDLQWQLGFLREDSPRNRPYKITEAVINFLNNRHIDAIALEAYRPTAYFCMAVTWWDLFPLRTVATAKHAIHLLQQAIETATEIGKLDICIYSFTRTYGEMIPVAEFIDHVQKGLDRILEDAGPNLYKRPDKEVIMPRDQDRIWLLMTLNY